MSNTTTPNSPPLPPSPTLTSAALGPAPIVCWIGLDWADKKHCLVVRAAGQPPQTHFVEQQPAALDQLILQLRAQHPQGRLGVCLEQSRGPVLYALLKYDFLALYPVNPRALADFRRAFAVSGAKDDPGDADLLGEMGEKHHQRLRPLAVEDQATRQLRLLVEGRRTVVEDRTGLVNRLGATLKCYYPLALDLVGEDLASPMALEFLRRWPNLAKLQAAKPGVVRAFFYAHNSRSEQKIQERLEAIKKAVALTSDPALLGPLQLQAQCLGQQLTAVQKSVAAYDQQIRVVFAGHSEAWLFGVLPGAGPVLAPRLAAAFGTMRENFPTAGELLNLSGVAPVRRQSGQQKTVHFRSARPKFLHQSLVEFAKCSVGQCEWARLLYEDQLRQGNSKWGALRVLAFKWVRILWRCWRDRVAYDETKYLRSLQKRAVKLYESLYGPLPALETTPVNNSQKHA